MVFYQRYITRKHEKLIEVKRSAQEDKTKLLELQKQKREAVKELHKRLRKDYADKLEMFLERSIDKGYKKTDIKNALILKGWPREFINKYVEVYFKEHHIWIKKMKKAQEQTEIYAKLKEEVDYINYILTGKK
jgi:hypothetical protein